MNTRTMAATILGVAFAFTVWYVISQTAPVSGGGFAIMMSRNNMVLVADSDILSYNAISHEFRLTSECVDRIKPMWSSGDFKITVEGEPVLSGVVVPSTVSRSYDARQIVLLYPGPDMDYMIMKLQLGYPWDFSPALSSPNPLDNALLVSHFGKLGKLTH